MFSTHVSCDPPRTEAPNVYCYIRLFTMERYSQGAIQAIFATRSKGHAAGGILASTETRRLKNGGPAGPVPGEAAEPARRMAYGRAQPKAGRRARCHRAIEPVLRGRAGPRARGVVRPELPPAPRAGRGAGRGGPDGARGARRWMPSPSGRMPGGQGARG